jgi:hypothetical protein
VNTRASDSVTTRLAFDYEVVSQLHSPIIRAVRAFDSFESYRAGRDLPAEHGFEGRAILYLVEYHVRTFASREQYIERVGVCFDLLAGGSYPFTKPAVTVVTRPIPWSPHFHLPSGTVCVGNIWANAGGRMLLAQMIVHVARLLNFDEPKSVREANWNREADEYWRGVLKCRPINSQLEYPILPSHVTHGEETAEDEFVAVGDDANANCLDGFLPLGVQS